MTELDYINPKLSQIHFTDGSVLKYGDLKNIRLIKDGVEKVYRQRSVHHTSESAEHYTPEHVKQIIVKLFGDQVDLDPCCENKNSPNISARNYYDITDDGLKQEWGGTVFCNPPYGRGIGAWVEKAVASKDQADILLLVPSRTDTKWFSPLWNHDILFFSGRLKFKNSGNKSGAPFPSALVLISNNEEFRKRFRELSYEYGRVK